tara:strand:+ start:52 stop:666 length:615 start_codon:yes stop_codon:yes gene_type:complete
MLRKIKLYGKLAEYVGAEEFEAHVSSVAEAVRFLLCNFPNIEGYMSPKYYQVKVGNYDIKEEEINYPVGQEDIHFVPMIAGAGSFGRFLLGAAMIGLAFATAGTSVSLAGGLLSAKGFAAAGFATKALLVGGGALVLGSVVELLFPLPELPDFAAEDDPNVSFQFNSLQNTSRAGTPIPVVYGEVFVGSVVISAALDTNQEDID